MLDLYQGYNGLNRSQRPYPTRCQLTSGVLSLFSLAKEKTLATTNFPSKIKPKRASESGASKAERRLAYILIAPTLLAFGLVAAFPLVSAFWLSLRNQNLKYRTDDFVGLQNYATIMSDERFWNALRVTLTFTVTTIVVETVLGLIIALAVNRNFVGRGLVRAAVLVPWALTTVVAARMWAWIFNSQSGIFNAVLYNLFLIEDYKPWTNDPNFALLAAIGADIWKTTPFMALLLLAGLQNIGKDLYEAARVDGATPWQSFWSITLPLLKPALLVALLFRTLDALRVFDLLFVLTGGGPGFDTESLSVYTYRTLFNSLEFGYGSALAMMMFVTTLFFSFLYIKVLGARTSKTD